MESLEKTRKRFGIRAKLTRWRFLGALVAATLVVLSYFLVILVLSSLVPIEWVSEETFLLLFAVAINPASFIIFFFLFLWKRGWAIAVVDRGVYLYRLAVYPYNILYFRAFKSETGMEAKLRRTGAKRHRAERKRAAAKHREFFRDRK